MCSDSRSFAIFRPILAGAAVLLLAVAGEARAYVIFLKDGSRIEAKEKPAVQGTKWIFIIPSGNRQSLPVSEIDEKKTEEFNAQGLGDSILLSEEKSKVLSQGTGRKPTLSEYIKTSEKSQIKTGGVPTGEPVEKPAAAAPPAAPAAKVAAAPADAGAKGQLDSVVSDAFTRALEGAGVRGARVTPVGNSLRVQAITENEQQVFAAIGAAARGLKESRASGRPLDKVELHLASAAGENAGRFNISPDDADALLNGKVSAAKYFVANVIF